MLARVGRLDRISSTAEFTVGEGRPRCDPRVSCSRVSRWGVRSPQDRLQRILAAKLREAVQEALPLLVECLNNAPGIWASARLLVLRDSPENFALGHRARVVRAWHGEGDRRAFGRPCVAAGHDGLL